VDELIRAITERAGIDGSQARTAIETVIEHLEARMPPPVASELRGAIAGKSDIAGEAERLKVWAACSVARPVRSISTAASVVVTTGAASHTGGVTEA